MSLVTKRFLKWSQTRVFQTHLSDTDCDSDVTLVRDDHRFKEAHKVTMTRPQRSARPGCLKELSFSEEDMDVNPGTPDNDNLKLLTM